MTPKSKRMPFAIAGIVGCCAIVLLVAIVAGGVYFLVAGGQIPTIGQQAIGGEIKDPIVTMLVASSLDNKGRVVDPKFTFDATQPQMTVIVQAGKVTNAPLDLVWYQVTDAGDQKLFEHHVQMDSYERAYSIGKHASLLASGTYKVVATLVAYTRTVEFDVTEKAAQPATGGAPVSTQESKPPVDGGSGKTTSPATSTTPPSSSDCDVDLANASGWEDYSTVADHVKIIVSHSCPANFDVTATVDGPFVWVASVLPSGPGKVAIPVNPCNLPGGSDLPGTRVRFDAGPNSYGVAYDLKTASPFVIKLGDDTSAPKLHVDSTPAKGTKVKAGDKISLKARAWEEKSGGSWQTGVMEIRVFAEQGGLFKSQDYKQYRGKSCHAKSWEQTLDATYTVPNNPPPVIHLCVVAEDFAGNKKTHCAEFLTGNTWKGKLHAVSTESLIGAGSCSNETWDGEFRVRVGGNGDVQGKGSAHLVAPPQCVSYATVCLRSQATQVEFVVEGKFDGRQFQFVFSHTFLDGGTCGLSNYTIWLHPGFGEVSKRSPPNFTIPVIAPGDAEGQVSNSIQLSTNQTANGQFTFSLLCEDCK